MKNPKAIAERVKETTDRTLKIAHGIEKPLSSAEFHRFCDDARDLAQAVLDLLEGNKVKRRSDSGRLAECQLCGSLDIGGAMGTVHCYGCGLELKKKGPLQNAIDAWNTRKGKPLED